MVVADARHRTSCRNNIAEMVEQREYILCRHRVSVLLFYTGNLEGYPAMHVGWRLLIDTPLRIFHRILGHPYSGGELITVKILSRSL